MMNQKHYIDIEHIREEDTDLRYRNTQLFKPGDIISITEKFDGSNLSIGWDSETNDIAVFSRNRQLSILSDMRGAYVYAMKLNKKAFSDNPDYIWFGEWAVSNKIKYDAQNMSKWRIFDIYDRNEKVWLTPEKVKSFCFKYSMEYIHELYYGPFISWEHCRSFMNSPAYGDRQEGIVVRNVSKMYSGLKYPWILKIVNDDFKESMKTRVRIVDPEAEEAKKAARTLVESIVTRNRVEKMLYKMIDGGILPEKLQPTDMRTISLNLPKLINDDCLKEEKEIVMECGGYWGKICAIVCMEHAKSIVLE